MDAITSIFSRPMASWGFNALDSNDQDSVVKRETIDTENQHVVTDLDEDDDGSDSDIEIIDSSSFKQRANSPKSKPKNHENADDSTAQNGRAGRKRADSPFDLSRDESPSKKTKVNGETTLSGTPMAKKPMLTTRFQQKDLSTNENRLHGDHPPSKLASRIGLAGLPRSSKFTNRPVPNRNFDHFMTLLNKDVARSQDDVSEKESQSSLSWPPPPSATAPSSNRRRLGGTLDHIESSMVAKSTSAIYKSVNERAPVSKNLRSTNPSSVQPQHRSNTRLGIPFDEDDSDEEDLFCKEPNSGQDLRTSLSKVIQEQSEPEFDEIVVASRPSLQEQTTEKPSSGDRNLLERHARGNDKAGTKRHSASRPPSHLDKIRRQQSMFNSGPLRYSGGMHERSITGSKHSSSAFPRFESSIRPLENEVRNQRTPIGDYGTSTTASKNRDANARPDLTDDKDFWRPEISPQNQKAFIPKSQATPAPETIAKVKSSPDAISILSSLKTTAADSRISKSFDAAEEAEIRWRREAEKAQKEEAAKARKEADSRREAEASQKITEKRQAEKAQWEEGQKAVQARRATERQWQQRATEEERVFSERKVAMSKLSNVKPPPQPPPKKPQSGSIPGFNEFLFVASSREETVPLHLSSKPNKEAIAIVDYGMASGCDKSTIQDTPRTTSTAAAPRPTDAAREARIREKKARNERHRLHEKEEEQGQLVVEREEAEQHRPDESCTITPAGDTAPECGKGPFALNSAIGQRLLSERKTSPGKTKHGRKLGEITAADIQLVKWKDNPEFEWAHVVKLWSMRYKSRTQDTLRKRYRQVKDAIERGLHSERQRADLFAECEETRLELNRKINGDVEVSGQSAPPRLRNGEGAPIAKSRQSIHLNLIDQRKHQTSLSPAIGYEPQSLTGSSLTPEPSHEKGISSGRPTEGGKSMNAEVFQYYLESLAEAYAEDEEDAESIREPSLWGPDDYAPFTYQVERRELDQDALNDGQRIDEEDWTICGRYREFNTALGANLEAYQELFRDPEFGLPGVNLSKGREHRTDIEEGMEFHELKGSFGGVRQVRVTRYMRSFGRGELPHNKEGWAPRTVYLVKYRSIYDVEPEAPSRKTPSEDGEIDELFEERPEQATKQRCQTNVEGVYTILELANMAAAKYFVEQTFTPKSGNLRLRAFEIQEEESKFLKTLDEGEEFVQEGEYEDVKGTFKVWVEGVELKGPRNLD